MAKTKCANCGEPMLETFTRVWLRLWICGHTKMNIVKSRSGVAKQGEIYCALDVKGLRSTFETFTKNSNLTLESLRKATHGTVSDAQLLESANLAIMLGLPINTLDELFESSCKLGYALGVDTKKAIESLCKGVGRRSRLILDNIGIAFKAKEAYDAYPDLDRNEAWQRHALDLIKEKASELQLY